MKTFSLMLFVSVGITLALCGCATTREPAEPYEPWVPNVEALRSCGEASTLGIRGPRFRMMMDDGCERLLNDLSMEFDYELTNLSVAAPLRRIDGVFKLRENPITSFHGLERLESLGSVLLVISVPVRDATGLGNLRLVEGDVRFMDNAQLNSFAGLDRLERVGGLAIVRNPALENLDDLRGLRRVDGDLQIIDNPGLSPEEIEDFLSHVEVGGRVQLAYDM